MGDINWINQSGYLTNNQLNMDFQVAAQPLQRFRQFVDFKSAFGKQKGQTENWLKVSNVDTRGGTLVETNTMNESSQTLSWGTVTVNEIGLAIPFTGKLETLSEFDIKQIIREGLLNDCVKVIDGLVEREMNKTPLRYVGVTTASGSVTTNSVGAATNTSILNSFHIRKMRLELEKRNVPVWEGGDYAMIASLEAAESLEGAMETINSYTESGYAKILSGEIGRIHGVRVVKDGYASRYTTDATARTATAISWTTGNSGPAYMFGRPTVREIVSVPEEIRAKVVTDYGRSKGLAYYAILGHAIEWADEGNARIIKWDSAA